MRNYSVSNTVKKHFTESALNVVEGVIMGLAYIAMTCWLLSLFASIAVQNSADSEIQNVKLDVFDSGLYELRRGISQIPSGQGEELLLGFPALGVRAPAPVRLTFEIRGTQFIVEHTVPLQWGQVLVAQISKGGEVTWISFTRFYFPPQTFLTIWILGLVIAFGSTKARTYWNKQRVQQLLR